MTPGLSAQASSTVGSARVKRRSFLLGSAAVSAAFALDGVSAASARSTVVPYTQTYLSPGPLAAHPDDACYVIRPRQIRSSSPVVMYLHGAGETATTALGNSTQLTTFLQSLAGLGYTVLVADFGEPGTGALTSGSQTFGNHFVAGRMEEYRQWLATKPAVASNANASTIGLLGSSMGAANALAYARDHRSLVSVAGTAIPFTDIAWTRSDRTDPVWTANGFLASLCDTAWQLLATDATPPDADFNTLASLVGLPWRGYYRSDDPIVNPARLEILQSHIGGSSGIFDVGTTGGHNTNIWGDLSFSAFTSWFSTYLPVPAH